MSKYVKCINCRSKAAYYRKETEDYRCSNCKSVFNKKKAMEEKARKEWMLEAIDSRITAFKKATGYGLLGITTLVLLAWFLWGVGTAPTIEQYGMVVVYELSAVLGFLLIIAGGAALVIYCYSKALSQSEEWKKKLNE